MPITVSIVEDDRDTRDHLAALLNSTTTLRCLHTYPTGEKALGDIPREPPTVVLVDINLPGMSGIECVARLKARVPGLHLVMLTMYEENDLIFDALRAGASGYLLKSMPPEELLRALEDARKVVHYFHRTPISEAELGVLSPREYEVLSLLAKGRLYKEIASELGITLGTVRTHQQRIYEKLHVQSRTEATVKFLRWGRDV